MSRPRRKPTPGNGLGALMRRPVRPLIRPGLSYRPKLRINSLFSETCALGNRTQPKKWLKNRPWPGLGVLSPDAVHRIAVLTLLIAASGCKHAPKVDPPKSSVTASASA